jgi:hypothetical protein
MLLMPLAKTPMDKRGAQSMRTYSQKIDRAIEGLTPWTSESKFNALRRKYGKSMEDSQIVVHFDASDDPNNPLFEGVTTESDLRRKAKD